MQFGFCLLFVNSAGTILLMCVYVCLSVSVTSRCSVEMYGRIGLVVTLSFFSTSLTLLQENSGIYKMMVRPSGTFS